MIYYKINNLDFSLCNFIDVTITKTIEKYVLSIIKFKISKQKKNKNCIILLFKMYLIFYVNTSDFCDSFMEFGKF